MFISYECQKYLGYDDKIGRHKYQYKIVDSDFEKEIKAGTSIILAVIEVYEKRNLPVAPNLIKAILWLCNEQNYSINDILDWYGNDPKFTKYEKELEKYLILL
jgi:hypothetical protein